MYSFAIAEAWSSDEMWAWFCIGGELRDAVAALEAAASELLPLTVDTEWRSRGIEALHERLADLRARTALDIGELALRRSEVDGIAS